MGQGFRLRQNGSEMTFLAMGTLDDFNDKAFIYLVSSVASSITLCSQTFANKLILADVCLGPVGTYIRASAISHYFSGLSFTPVKQNVSKLVQLWYESKVWLLSKVKNSSLVFPVSKSNHLTQIFCHPFSQVYALELKMYLAAWLLTLIPLLKIVLNKFVCLGSESL